VVEVVVVVQGELARSFCRRAVRRLAVISVTCNAARKSLDILEKGYVSPGRFRLGEIGPAEAGDKMIDCLLFSWNATETNASVLALLLGSSQLISTSSSNCV
jgi:hypothetical protein